MKPLISISLNPAPYVEGALTLDSPVVWVTDRRGDSHVEVFPDSPEGEAEARRAHDRTLRLMTGETPLLRHWYWSPPAHITVFRLRFWPGGIPGWLEEKLAPTEAEVNAAWLADMVERFGHGGI